MKALLFSIPFFLLTISNCISQNFSWYTLPAAPVSNGRWEDIYFVNAETGWLIGGIGAPGSAVFKTTDGGISWICSDTLHSTAARCITFLNELTGWIGTLNADFRFLKTTDGGFTWDDVILPNPQPEGICGMYKLNDKFIFGSGYYAGSPIFIKTSDGGVTWSTKDMSSYARGLVDCYFFNEDSGIVVGSRDTFTTLYRSNILFTSDGGETWSSKYMGTRLSEECWKISFPSRLTGYVSLERSGSGERRVAKTTNGGSEWFEVPFLNNIFVQGIGFVDENTGWIGASSTAYGTTDGGLTWGPTIAGNRINRIRFLSDTLGYAAGETVYKYSRTVSITNISQVAQDYFLEQNYPNPFNPVTKIKFSISNPGHTTLRIYNSIGMMIKETVNTNLARGVYEVNFDAYSFATGIYFYKLESGEYLSTRKMMLIK